MDSLTYLLTFFVMLAAGTFAAIFLFRLCFMRNLPDSDEMERLEIIDHLEEMNSLDMARVKSSSQSSTSKVFEEVNR